MSGFEQRWPARTKVRGTGSVLPALRRGWRAAQQLHYAFMHTPLLIMTHKIEGATHLARNEDEHLVAGGTLGQHQTVGRVAE